MLELPEFESKLKLRLTIRYHIFLGVSQISDTFRVSTLFRDQIFYGYYTDIRN